MGTWGAMEAWACGGRGLGMEEGRGLGVQC